jgi:Uri superfamily endonuclease
VKSKGAYILYLDVKRPLTLMVGSLGKFGLPAGRYAYIGSARSGIAGRVARHRRLAKQKTGKVHWHIDYVLIDPHSRWAGESVFEHGIECKISKQIACVRGVTIPIPGFGSTDCRAGCAAHLYRLPRTMRSLEPALRLEGSKNFDSEDG